MGRTEIGEDVLGVGNSVALGDFVGEELFIPIVGELLLGIVTLVFEVGAFDIIIWFVGKLVGAEDG